MLLPLLAAAAIGAPSPNDTADPALGLSKSECVARGGFWKQRCFGPLKGEALELTEEISATITQALTDRVGESVEIVDATRERRKEGEVVCGLYATRAEKVAKSGRPFSWSDGHLIMTWGPNWNIGTVCLIANYHFPLP